MLLATVDGRFWESLLSGCRKKLGLPYACLITRLAEFASFTFSDSEPRISLQSPYSLATIQRSHAHMVEPHIARGAMDDDDDVDADENDVEIAEDDDDAAEDAEHDVDEVLDWDIDDTAAAFAAKRAAEQAGPSLISSSQDEPTLSDIRTCLLGLRHGQEEIQQSVHMLSDRLDCIEHALRVHASMHRVHASIATDISYLCLLLTIFIIFCFSLFNAIRSYGFDSCPLTTELLVFH